MKNYLFFLVACLGTLSCHQHHHGEELPLSLNNGEKWQVNAEMKPHIMEGERILTQYLTDGGTDYKALAKELKSQNNKLIKSCTMDGKSHEELHKWLHPHMNLVSQLKKADDELQAKQVIEALEQSFSTYAQFFD